MSVDADSRSERADGAQIKQYRIEVRGEFGELLSNAFSDLLVETGHGETVLTADVVDRPHLQAILDRLGDFAVEVVSSAQWQLRAHTVDVGA